MPIESSDRRKNETLRERVFSLHHRLGETNKEGQRTMINDYERLRLRILLYFRENSQDMCAVVKIARTLGVTKQRVSRILIDFEKEGLLDRSDIRTPVLTAKGREMAAYYAERINVSLNHLLYEGVPLEQAEEDAYHWALYNTDETMDVIRSAEARFSAKYELRGKQEFTGKELCRHLRDGDFEFNFVMYRQNSKRGNNLSMANRGFEHPGYLIVRDGVGKIRLRAVEITAKSPVINKVVKGKVENLSYYHNGVFTMAETSNSIITIPAEVINFVNIGTGVNQFLHGSVNIKLNCTVSPVHMPESEAVFTMIL